MSTKLGGYAGTVLRVDLSSKEVSVYPFSDEERALYLGGKIMAAKIINDISKTIPSFGPHYDPFSEHTPIVITSCPLTDMGSPCSSRFNTSTISPLTGLYTSSNCGGNFAMNLKRAGYDALVIVGKAQEHTYLKISDDMKVEFKNADALWGKTTGEAQEEIERIEGRCGKFVIGPAGENLVRYACVVSEERAAGRGGVGAIFGSKNLKGICCQGWRTPEPKDRERLKYINREWVHRLRTHPLTGVQLPAMGTAALIAPMHAKHILATNNYRSGRYEHFEDISGEALKDKYPEHRGCTTCPIQCARWVDVNGKKVKGPEVETLGLFGCNIMNNDLQAILDWNNEMDELGLDTISCGNTIAYAMEANEKNLWKNGLEFGKIDNISAIIDEIAHRSSPVGNDLAEGSKRCAEKYGGKDFAMNAKGMELAAYEPRGAVGQGLGYAVGNRGGCHLNGGYLVCLEGLGLNVNQYTWHGKGALCAMFQDLMEAISAGGNCLFTSYAFFPYFLVDKPHWKITRFVNWLMPYLGPVIALVPRLAPMLKINLPMMMLPHPMAISAATGMKFNMGRFLVVGERGYNLERTIDVKLGVSGKDDELPKRLTTELQILSNPQSKVPLDKMKKDFYKARGWDDDGIPTKKTIKRLKLEGVVW